MTLWFLVRVDGYVKIILVYMARIVMYYFSSIPWGIVCILVEIWTKYPRMNAAFQLIAI